MKKELDARLPRMYMYYANLDDIRIVTGLLDDDKDDERGSMPAILKAAQYGRYGMFNVAETAEIGIAKSPCEKMTFAVLNGGVPVLVAKGIMMVSSIALAQAKENVDIGTKRDYKTLYEAALYGIEGLSDDDAGAVLERKVPFGYDSLIFDKAMAEDMDESEHVILIPDIFITREYIDNHDVINEALDDFCDFGMRRIVAVSCNIGLEEGLEADRFLNSVKSMKGRHVALRNGIFMLV